MKDRLSKFSKRATYALCLLAACGLTYSCADEYKLDDEAPTWLGSSIYGYLESEGNYTTFLKLIDDQGLKEVLSRTGSRTLFVANDSAFEEFYKRTDKPKFWSNVTSYDKFTPAQKKMLLNTAMLNNAYLLEMLPRAEGTAAKGASMRKQTLISLLDTIPLVTELPTTFSDVDKNYWKPYENKGLLMVSDNSTPMLSFYSAEFLSTANITNEDFEMIMKEPRNSNDFHIYNHKVVKQDVTCQNGYVNVLDEVMVPLGNMAEVLRDNPNTQVFSHILDRFSAPYYDASLVQSYKENVDQSFTDSIFVRKYYAQNTNASSMGEYLGEDGSLSLGPDKTLPSPNFGLLKFDPGWNQFLSKNNTDVNADMAAMFVPNDKALTEYFVSGGGKELLDTYGKGYYDGSSLESLFKDLDLIPLNVLNSFVNNLMQNSFINSVPSKFSTILDQANDNMFPDVSQMKQEIDDYLMANNGIIYLMNKVYSPVDFNAVVGPAYIGTDYQLMKFAIFNGSGSDGKNDLMGKMNFYAYLRASGGDINFSLLLPSDEALKYYVDPISLVYDANGSGKSRVLTYTYKNTEGAGTPPFTVQQFSYNPVTGFKSATPMLGGDPNAGVDGINRLKDILESHTIVHKANETEGILSGNEYYLTKGGAPVRVRQVNGKIQIQGGGQIYNETAYPNATPNIPGFFYSEVENAYDKSNGSTYCLNAPIAVSGRSVYKTMMDMQNDTIFFNLCDGVSATLLEKIGMLTYPSTNPTEEQKKREQKKYFIFMAENGLDKNVAFFTKYNYTVYVPSDQAMQYEIETMKLPTWEQIQAYVDANTNEEGVLDENAKVIAQAQAACLIDFLKAHFQDNSVFADKLPDASSSYNSAAINPETNKFYPIYASYPGGGKLELARPGYYDCEVTSTKNLIARDYVTSLNYAASSYEIKGATINSSAYAVVHEIDGTLRLIPEGSTYESENYSNKEQAQRTAALFRIKNK